MNRSDKLLKIISPLTEKKIVSLKAGDLIELSGVIYTLRDQAHQRIVQLLGEGKSLPLDLSGQTIYYAGPAPTRPEEVIGPVGPTTASRMDIFTPQLLKAGVKGMIGKGDRSPAVYDAIKMYKAVYLIAAGGAAAYLAQFVIKAEVVAYKELGPEAIHRLEVKEMPLIVGIDSRGGSVFWKLVT